MGRLALLFGCVAFAVLVVAVAATIPVEPTVPAARTPPALPECAITHPAPPIALADREMTPLCDDVYAEPDLTPVALASLAASYRAARRDVAVAFDQEMLSRPVVLFCQSPACKVALGASPEAARADDLGFASAQAQTPSGERVNRSIVVASGPFPSTARVLTHELVHAEMKAWTSYDALPTWFNEGMATFLAGEPNCEAHPAHGPDAPLVDVETLGTKVAWRSHLQAHHDTRDVYCESRHKVARWAERFATVEQRATALKALMVAVKDGTPFERAFAR